MSIQTIPGDGESLTHQEQETEPAAVHLDEPPHHRLETQIAALKHGDHLCMVYDDTAQQMRAAVPFIMEGLRRGERCVYIADDQSVEDVATALRDAGAHTGTSGGELVLITKTEAYLRAGSFDPQEMVAFLEESVHEALAEGFTGYRVTGEMTWALGTDVPCEGLIEYEALLNGFFPGSKALALCQYNRQRFPAQVVHDVLRTHPLAVLGDQVCQNLYYEPPEFVLKGGDDARRVDWMIQRLQEWHQLAVSRDELQREVTERKRVEAELQQAAVALEHSNQELEHFAYIASHDLQEPLRTISGYAQLLDRRHGDQLDDQAKRYIDRIMAGTERMHRLINQLLDYSRVQTRGGEFEAVELDETVGGVLRDLERIIEERGAEVHVGPLPRVVADASQMRHVFANLITNSIKYCPPGRAPVVAVTADETDEHWHIGVEDNGSGIPADQFERIFVLFQRLVPRTSDDPGTGMGLAISRRIVERHGGRIWVESTEGEGSVLHLTIPKRDEHHETR